MTATVASRPLIVSSILSKKLAAGADIIVLDVKTGSGAFMSTEADAFALARDLVAVGHMAGKRVIAVVTDMDEPLGHAVGNAVEVQEAIRALRGEYTGDLMELCYTLGSQILIGGGLAADEAAARAMLADTISGGTALKKLEAFIQAQGGDIAGIHDPTRLPTAPHRMEAICRDSGYVAAIDAEGVGLVSMRLGGGRITKESEIDLSVGVVLHKKVGDKIKVGDSIGTVCAASAEAAQAGAEQLLACFTIRPEPVERPPFIKGIVS